MSCGAGGAGPVRLGRRAEPDAGFVLFVGGAEERGEPGGAPDHEGQDTRGQRIERAGVADPAEAERAPHPRDHIVRGRPGGFVDDENAVESSFQLLHSLLAGPSASARQSFHARSGETSPYWSAGMTATSGGGHPSASAHSRSMRAMARPRRSWSPAMTATNGGGHPPRPQALSRAL
jgi:hypothetical protein